MRRTHKIYYKGFMHIGEQHCFYYFVCFFCVYVLFFHCTTGGCFFHYFFSQNQTKARVRHKMMNKINKQNTCLLHIWLINILSKIKHNFLNGKQPTTYKILLYSTENCVYFQRYTYLEACLFIKRLNFTRVIIINSRSLQDSLHGL